MKQISSSQRLDYLRSLHPIVKTYEAAPTIQRQANQRSVLVVSGPSGVGKDAIINYAGIERVQNVTTRPQRTHIGETTGQGYSHFYNLFEAKGRWEIRRDLGGLLVQAEVTPTEDIYGSRIEDYPEHGILNATARTFERLRRQRLFWSICQAYIVSPTPERWITQLDTRDGIDSVQRTNRIIEAHASLNDGLRSPHAIFIINDTVQDAAEQLTAVMTGQELPSRLQQAGLQAALAMKAAIENGDIIRYGGQANREASA